MSVQELLSRLAAEDDARAKEAAVALGLALEARARRDAGGEALSQPGLEAGEAGLADDFDPEAAVSGLAQHVRERGRPAPAAVWAIGRWPSERSSQLLLEILADSLARGREALAAEAFSGLCARPSLAKSAARLVLALSADEVLRGDAAEYLRPGLS